MADRTVGGSSFARPRPLAGVTDVAVTRAAEGQRGPGSHVAVVALWLPTDGASSARAPTSTSCCCTTSGRGVGAVARMLCGTPCGTPGFPMGTRCAHRASRSAWPPRPGHADVPARRAPGGRASGRRRATSSAAPPNLARRRRRPLLETLARRRAAARAIPAPSPYTADRTSKNGAGGLRDLQAPVLGRGPRWASVRACTASTASGVVDDSDAAELRARRRSSWRRGWPCTGRRVGDRTCSPYRTAPPWPRSPAAATATTSCGRWPA